MCSLRDKFESIYITTFLLQIFYKTKLLRHILQNKIISHNTKSVTTLAVHILIE